MLHPPECNLELFKHDLKHPVLVKSISKSSSELSKSSAEGNA